MSKTRKSHHRTAGGRNDANFLKVVEKVFRVIETLAPAEHGMRISDLARELKQPKATIYRILFTLQNLGYVRQDPDSLAYVCTAHVGWLTRDQANETLRQIARSQMERLLARFEQTVNLAVFDQERVFYLEILQGLRSIRMAATPMTFAPVHSTAVGKAILAFLHPHEASQILGRGPLEKYTPKTATSANMILGQLKKIREKGYSIDNEETETGARCLAAPIFNSHGRPVAAISISGPVSYMHPKTCDQVAKALREATQKISTQLGFLPWREGKGESRRQRLAVS